MRRRRIRTKCEKQHRAMRRFGLTVAAILLCACQAQADTITQVQQMITDNSLLPLAPGMALDLAQNLMTAQADSSYAASEPDSLALSETAVLRAIMLEGTLFGVTEIVYDPASLAWLQSEIAIDDNAGVSISINGVPCNPDGDCTINFGKVLVPEPEEIIMSLVGLDALLVLAWLKRRRVSL